ncbi:MAG: hypothetical protein Tp1124DCM108671_27 [Prokaryotic dsDNA virus sp.]|nr:MAG: hypothetical protein Tp1125DCM102451_47 [Prokaryotic dsDNA virus sp.]QDP65584.1 MAG: hypothetical protein Tp1124DCM108671_27 [Prokaryotic dsDNA virus sp.]|tara:strand:- start:2266 stop:2760 length:495 start_codon:yes stop_codon:yes gene_type:complete
MLHITYGSDADFYVTTEEKRIDTSVANSRIRLLFKFTNDMTGTVKYCYGNSPTYPDTIYNRYQKVEISHNTSENRYTGNINFKPYGFWHYKIYEVSYNGAVPGTLNADNSPATETTAAVDTGSTHGTLKGEVESGKLYVTETSGSEQVRYTTHTETTTNYLYTN